MASKRLGALPKARRGVLGSGCGRECSGALPLARAAAVSTDVRVQAEEKEHGRDEHAAPRPEVADLLGVRVRS